MTRTVRFLSFDGTLGQADGVIQVDRETFQSCPYMAQDIVSLLSDPDHYLWIAEHQGSVAGYVAAFPTQSLARDRWEVDELAVATARQGAGIGTALVERAVLEGMALVPRGQGRALVATHNTASECVFVKNGFGAPRRVDLLLYEVSGRVPRPGFAGRTVVRSSETDDASQICALAGCDLDRALMLLSVSQNQYLVAEEAGRVVGYVELIPVSTLQYRGLWLESLAVPAGDRECVHALIDGVIECAKADEQVEQVGYLVPPGEEVSYYACIGRGFSKIDEYNNWYREFDGG